MNESLSEDELAELIRHGRINNSRSASKRNQTSKTGSPNIKSQSSAPRPGNSPREAELPKASENEPDPEWLRAEKEKAERNIAAQRQDKQRRDEMQDASKF